MSMNRQNNKSPPCSTSNPKNDDAWSLFLVVEAADDNSLPLTRRCSIFALNTAIKGMGGNYKFVKPLTGGRQLLVHFDNKIYSENLLYMTNKLVDIPVKVSPQRTMNYKRCVIFCKELAGMDEEEIADELKPHGVVKVERMKRIKDGKLIPADSFIITVETQTIPREIKVGFLNKETKVYIPNPQRYFNCQGFGHNKRFCSKSQKCANCGPEDHEDKYCENDPHCVNCDGHHPPSPPYFSSCPKWKIEKKILQIKYEDDIPFSEARKRVEPPVSDPSKNSFATISKPHQWTNNITPPNNFRSEEEWIAHTIESLFKRQHRSTKIQSK